jgi:PIN domain nuclease of toxin-antitoxin system
MIALLDTHSFLWAAIEPQRLSPKARKAITDSANQVFVSTVSLWEISLKFSLGKLEIAGSSPEALVSVAQEMGLGLVAPSPEESAGFHRLPKIEHKDPFDRMLVWQCLQNQWTFITRDRAMGEYRSLGLKTYW